MADIVKVLAFVKPYTKRKGIYLEKKIVVWDTIINNQRTVIIDVDIASSFQPNECVKIKNYLRKQGFINCGSGCFQIKLPITGNLN